MPMSPKTKLDLITATIACCAIVLIALAFIYGTSIEKWLEGLIAPQ